MAAKAGHLNARFGKHKDKYSSSSMQHLKLMNELFVWSIACILETEGRVLTSFDHGGGF